MVDAALSPQEQADLDAGREALRQKKEAALARRQAIAAYAKEHGLSQSEAKQVIAEAERIKKQREARAKKAEATQKREQDKQTKAEKSEQDRAQRTAEQKEARQRRQRERVQARFQYGMMRAIGLSSSTDTLTDLCILAVFFSVLGTTVFVNTIYVSVTSAWDSFCSSRIGRMIGCSSDDQEVVFEGTTVEADAIVQAALGWAGRDFNPGQKEQCAYFVRAVFEEVGIKLGVTTNPLDGHSTGEGFANSFYGEDLGQIIKDKSDLKPGDVVMFFNTYGDYPKGTVTHVGIYVGDGKMVDRPTASAPVAHRGIDAFEFAGALRPKELVGGGASATIAVDFMKQAGIEGFHEKPYWDYAQYSWGHGTKAPCSTDKECAGLSITPEQAHQDMVDYLARNCSPLLQPFALSNSQEAAALSLCYNLGPAQFKSTQAFQAIEAGDLGKAIAMFDACINADGVALAGLVKRRNMEQQLWGMPDYEADSADGQSCMI